MKHAMARERPRENKTSISVANAAKLVRVRSLGQECPRHKLLTCDTEIYDAAGFHASGGERS
jgi:hypothetical protein